MERESPPRSHAGDLHRPQGSPAGPFILTAPVPACDDALTLGLAQALSLSLCVADSRQITC